MTEQTVSDERLKELMEELEQDNAGMSGFYDVLQVARELRRRREQERWIPCGEMMPTDPADVLCRVKDYTIQGSYWKDHWEDIGGFPIAVTHWRPLPEPPSDGEVKRG